MIMRVFLIIKGKEKIKSLKINHSEKKSCMDSKNFRADVMSFKPLTNCVAPCRNLPKQHSLVLIVS